jgi:hypothetical protein
MDTIVFGIGCFHLETRPHGPKNNRGWASSVRRVLESIPSVRDVEITEPTSLKVPRSARADQDEWPEDAQLLTPHPQDASLVFRVNIPKRIQDELAWNKNSSCGTESFLVWTIYTVWFPVTYVVCESAPSDADGSEAVMIVREFLEREILQREDEEKVSFIALGPSPFHAICKLEPTEHNEHLSADGFGYTRRETPGYASLDFAYDKSTYKSGGAAMARLAYILADEIGYFYDVVNEGNVRTIHLSTLAERAQELVDLHVGSGIKTRIERIFRGNRMARDLALSLIAAELEFSRAVDNVQHSSERVQKSSRLPVLASWIEAEIRPDYEDEVQTIRRTVELLDARQLRDANTVVVFVTAILGGVVGAVATRILS